MRNNDDDDDDSGDEHQKWAEQNVRTAVGKS